MFSCRDSEGHWCSGLPLAASSLAFLYFPQKPGVKGSISLLFLDALINAMTKSNSGKEWVYFSLHFHVHGESSREAMSGAQGRPI